MKENYSKMTTYRASGLVEGFIVSKHDKQIVEAWQYLIDTGIAWQFQGWYGRTALHLIEEGICKPPREE